jgi:amidohydrolase
VEALAALKRTLQAEIDGAKDEIAALARQIHDNPEIAFTEVKASKWLADYLDKQGFKVARGVGGLETAFHGVVKRGAGPTIAFLCEYDALPKIGHACGHNLICTASLAAGVAFARSQGWSGTVAVFGTPAEEGGGGKITMLNNGVFEGIDATLMFHPSDETVVHRGGLGRIALKVEFRGRSAHAASRPEMGLNALDAMISFFVSVGLMRQQLRDEARVHGVITNGGVVPNVIPDYTEAAFSVRSLSKAYNEQLLERLMNCAKGAATATGTEVSFKVNPLAYEPKLQNAVLGELFHANLKTFDIGDIRYHKDPGAGGIGSSDIGNLSQIVPTINPYLKIADVPTHSPEFAQAAGTQLGVDRMIVAGKAMAMTAADLFLLPEKMRGVRDDFEKNRGK